MERRDFIKISALSGVMATLEGCRSAEKQLIRFVPEEELVPGIATLKPSVCTLCSAGCGLQVRVMQGEAEVVRRGQQGLIKMGLAKKLEGNPQHPVNRGKLCARGQAGLQVLYHPDRITHPIKRTGARGSGEFQEISWDDAIKELTAHLTALQASNATNSLAFLAPAAARSTPRIDRALPEGLWCAARGLVPAFRRGCTAPGKSAQLWPCRSCPRSIWAAPTMSSPSAPISWAPGTPRLRNRSVTERCARAGRDAGQNSCRWNRACRRPAPTPTNGFHAGREWKARWLWASRMSS